MNIAITGACGLLGAHLCAALSRQYRVVGFDRHPWWGTREMELHIGDLADAHARQKFLMDARPDILVHCAGMIDVDTCERQPADAYFVNGTITGLLAREVSDDCRVVYITTDGIFSGEKPMSGENDLPCPRTVYARSKLHGEWETQLAARRHLIIRTNFYGWSAGHKTTFAEWLFRALINEESITLFDDFWFTPIYVTDLVERIIGLVTGPHDGIFHVGGAERVSKYEFGLRMAASGNLSTARLGRGSIASAELLAPRPRDMSLSSDKAAIALGFGAPDCDSGLRRFLAHREYSLEERVSHLKCPPE